MSSQGPSISGTPSDIVFAANPPGTQVSSGYKFDKDSLRDGSDWIALKKQTLIFNENKTKTFKDPWFVHGNNYRLQYLQGQYKNGLAPGCTGCDAGAFTGTGPF
jgi:hypothetical protein